MDLCAAKYTDPFSYMDRLIKNSLFFDFVMHVISEENKRIEDKQEREIYELWLFRVLDKSYEDFRESIRNTEENIETSDEELEATVKHSYNMLKNFTPEGRG